MKHWGIDQVGWDGFDPARLDPDIVPLVKAAAMVERNGDDYALYLQSVFHDDPDFHQAAAHWAEEEVQHGDALGRWAMLADPAWDFDAAFRRYREGFKIDVKADASIRGSRTGELIARCMVETGTSSYYTALGEATEEPVLKQVCRLIAADEYRHFKLFYDHMKRYLARENLSFARRLRVAAGRIGESEDDELAFAFHCGNEAAGIPYDHDRCIAGYMGRAMRYYRYRHIERGMGMVFKSVGLEPRGRLAALAARGAWRLLSWRRKRYEARITRSPRPAAQPALAA
ncbi:ferritin-like domain-containing protein [Falsiroseomonas selenitidurans]|uniref:Ferritin-like domain-containing protein n=1 Tax=Falsiroseomonas selenitidurans TaxID=2716335 RepID=A0ABX1E699_9PROT|nr:ferritin-like domain-containing protein [Falsiroseomonas selenitidurans]NKC32709.1 ferritin-like domain-containing protein [Falsiroseomonas selenitidurans]